jgi:hypothetical protein
MESLAGASRACERVPHDRPIFVGIRLCHLRRRHSRWRKRPSKHTRDDCDDVAIHLRLRRSEPGIDQNKERNLEGGLVRASGAVGSGVRPVSRARGPADDGARPGHGPSHCPSAQLVGGPTLRCRSPNQYHRVRSRLTSIGGTSQPSAAAVVLDGDRVVEVDDHVDPVAVPEYWLRYSDTYVRTSQD